MKICTVCKIKRVDGDFLQSGITEDGITNKCRPCIIKFNKNFIKSRGLVKIMDKIKLKVKLRVGDKCQDYDDMCQEVFRHFLRYYDHEKSTLKRYLSCTVPQEVHNYKGTHRNQLISESSWIESGKTYHSDINMNLETMTEEDQFEALIYNKAAVDYETDARSSNPLHVLLGFEVEIKDVPSKLKDFKFKGSRIRNNILQLLLEGKTQMEIGEIINLKQHTISYHIAKMKSMIKEELGGLDDS